MQTKSDRPADRERLWELIKGIRFGMFTTRHANGHLHSRPMTTQNSEIAADNSLWFFMSRSSEPVADLQADEVVNVVYADTDADRYVSVSGTARLVDDATKKEQLWNKMTEAWFPAGPKDPDLALVQIVIIHAHFWDVKESKLVQLFQMARAVVTGKPVSGLGEQAEIRMS